MNRPPIIHCEHLSKSYIDAGVPVEVLKDIHFSIFPGELIGIVGMSGAGKTTLLQLLGGLDHPTSGSVQWMQHDLVNLNEKQKGKLRNQHVGFVYQFHHLLPEFSALENVALPSLVRGDSCKEAQKKAKNLIDRVGLSHRASHRVGDLSGGERQRIAIARALVTEPRCVLADEPTGNLDSQTAEQVFELILQLNQELNISFVIVTHNHLLASRLHRTLVLKGGELV